MVYGFKGIEYKDPDFFNMQVLATILGGGMSSRLFQEVREKRGLAYTIQAYTSFYSDSGMFTVYSGTSPEKAGELISVITDELLKVTNFITDEELERAKNQLKAGTLMEQESTIARAEEMGRSLICFEKFMSPKEVIENINSVEKSAVTKLMKRIISQSLPTVTATGDIRKVPDYQEVSNKLKP